MALKSEDLPVDPEQVSEETVAWLEEHTVLEDNDDVSKCTDIILILAQLDPTETIDMGDDQKEPRWSGPQQQLIFAARDQLEAWQES